MMYAIESDHKLYLFLHSYIFICLVIHLIIYVFAFFRWVVCSCKPLTKQCCLSMEYQHTWLTTLYLFILQRLYQNLTIQKCCLWETIIQPLSPCTAEEDINFQKEVTCCVLHSIDTTKPAFTTKYSCIFNYWGNQTVIKFTKDIARHTTKSFVFYC